MKMLLDTHILLWVLVCPKKLPGKALQFINQVNSVFFSPVNWWEVGTKSSIWPEYGISRIDALHASALQSNLRELPVLSADTILSTTLPPLHRDPIDRILIAQSHNNQCHLLTVDDKIAWYQMPNILLI